MKFSTMGLAVAFLLQASMSLTLASIYDSCVGRCNEGRFDNYAIGQCACYEGCGFDCCPDYSIVCSYAPPNPCDGIKCGPYSHCEAGDYGAHKCVCDKGYVYDGIFCKPPPDPCDGIHCGPFANCESRGKKYECVCIEGYVKYGAYCLKKDPCKNKFCGPYATCHVNKLGQPVCRCIDGYVKGHTGICKKINPCSTVDCGINSDCVPDYVAGTAKCVCQEGFQDVGGICKRIFPCDGSPCHPHADCVNVGYNDYTCTCRQDYYGDGHICDYDPCRAKKCGPFKVCIQDLLTGKATCECKPGYHDVYGKCILKDPCSVVKCSKYQECKANYKTGTAVCVCKDGYYEKFGKCVLINPCDKIDCRPNSHCVPNYKFRTAVCVCNKGYHDKYGKCVLINPCSTVLCKENQKCVPDFDQGTATCVCKEGYHEKYGKCVHINPCIFTTCGPDRICVPQSNGEAKCVCKEGYHEVHGICKRKDPCILMFCGGNKRCVVDPLTGEGKCVCKKGYVEKCDKCVPKNPCDGVNCPFPSTCSVDANGLPECVCGTGYMKDLYGDCIVEDPSYSLGNLVGGYPGPTIYPPSFTCSDPENIKYGSHDGECKAYFPAGSTVTYTCDKGYLMSGEATRTCIGGRWVPEKPLCRKPLVNYCPHMKKPFHGDFTGKKPKYTDGDIVTFYCKPGYILAGSKHRVCNGSVWSGTKALCIVDDTYII